MFGPFIDHLLEGGFVLKYVLKGGPFMYPLVFVSILSIACIIDRLWVLIDQNLKGKKFLNELDNLIEDDSLDKKDFKGMIFALCDKYPNPSAEILRVALQKSDKPYKIIEKHMESIGALEVSKLEKGLRALANVSNLAPLIGFLGTVWGIIQAFEVIGTARTIDPQQISVGISQALIMSAGGLAVAIPASVFYNLFAGVIGRFVGDMLKSAHAVFDKIIYFKELTETTSSNS